MRQKLHDGSLARAIQEFHASIHGEEVSPQLNGIRPSEYLAPPTVRYQLPGRALTAKLFSEVVDAANRDELYQLRMSLIRELALHCSAINEKILAVEQRVATSQRLPIGRHFPQCPPELLAPGPIRPQQLRQSPRTPPTL